MPDPGVSTAETLPDLREQELERRLKRLAFMMKTLGELSHKINNPLTALLGRAQLLRLHSSDPQVAEVAGVIEASSLRVAEYARELALVVKECREESEA